MQRWEKGGNAPCILNAANEMAVSAFLNDQIGFLEMSDVIEHTLARATSIEKPIYDDYMASDAEARRIAAEHINGVPLSSFSE